MKPVALAYALASGADSGRTYDAPNVMTIEEPGLCGPNWTVHGGRGSTLEKPVRVDLALATHKSLNVVYAQLMVDIEPTNFVMMAESLGARKDSIAPVCAAVLGTEDVNMLELASMYSTFGRSGKWVEPVMVTKILRSDGTSVYQHETKSALVLKRSTANQVTAILEGVISEGTGKKADINRPAAGKTGTAQNYADATFAGYTPNRATAVWVGYPAAQIPMVPPATDIRVSGGSYPALIWREIMLAAHESIEITNFIPPPPSETSASTTTEPPLSFSVKIPDLVGRKWDDESLTAELDELSLTLATAEIPTSEFAPGTIIAQAPAAGSMQPSQTTINVEIAIEPELPTTITIPDVVNLNEGQARQVLASAGLAIDVVKQANPNLTDGLGFYEPGSNGTRSYERDGNERGTDESNDNESGWSENDLNDLNAAGIVWRQEPSAGVVTETDWSVKIWVNPTDDETDYDETGTD